MTNTYLRGDIFYADLSPVIGSEQGGMRPVIIIQNNMGNEHSPTVIVATITGKAEVKTKLPTHCPIGQEAGLPYASIILLEQLRTIDKVRLSSYVGKLSKQSIEGLNRALGISVGLMEPLDNKKLLLCLCHACVGNFYGTGDFIIRRADRQQVQKDTCTYCNQRKGYDYEIWRKQ